MDARDEEVTALKAVNARQAEETAVLKAQIDELLERPGRNSRNFHLQPSSEGPGSGGPREIRKTSGAAKKRRRGGQRGHECHRRELLPPEQMDHFIDLYLPECGNCWAPLPRTPDSNAARYQVTELPKTQPETMEYRRDSVTCRCGYTAKGRVDAVPTSPFGQRLMSVVILFTGVYRLSRRRAVTLLQELLGVEMSLGAVSAIESRASEALRPAVDEAWSAAKHARVKHADATDWLQNGKLRSLWTIATDLVTVFKILADGSAASIKPAVEPDGLPDSHPGDCKQAGQRPVGCDPMWRAQRPRGVDQRHDVLV